MQSPSRTTQQPFGHESEFAICMCRGWRGKSSSQWPIFQLIPAVASLLIPLTSSCSLLLLLKLNTFTITERCVHVHVSFFSMQCCVDTDDLNINVTALEGVTASGQCFTDLVFNCNCTDSENSTTDATTAPATTETATVVTSVNTTSAAQIGTRAHY